MLPSNPLGAAAVIGLVGAMAVYFGTGLAWVTWSAARRIFHREPSMNAGVIRVYSANRTLLAELVVERSGIRFAATGIALSEGRFGRAEWRTPAGEIFSHSSDGLPSSFIKGETVSTSFEAWGPVVKALAESSTHSA